MTAKKLSRDQKRKQKKQKRAQRQNQADFPGRYKPLLRRWQEAGFGDQKIAYNPPGQDKMSEVMWQFIAPYKQYAESADAMRKLIMTAVVAWNTTLMPEAQQTESLQKVAQALPAGAVEDFTAIVRELMERKKKYFAQYQRYILDYQLTESADQYHLSVISTVGPAETGRHDDPSPANS